MNLKFEALGYLVWDAEPDEPQLLGAVTQLRNGKWTAKEESSGRELAPGFRSRLKAGKALLRRAEARRSKK